jgi:hypothetical protein
VAFTPLRRRNWRGCGKVRSCNDGPTWQWRERRTPALAEQARSARECESGRGLPHSKTLVRFAESQRDSVLQPRVARDELPWVKVEEDNQPQRGCSQRRNARRREGTCCNPFWVGDHAAGPPRVARSEPDWSTSQPRAKRGNPVGVDGSGRCPSIPDFWLLASVLTGRLRSRGSSVVPVFGAAFSNPRSPPVVPGCCLLTSDF